MKTLLSVCLVFITVLCSSERRDSYQQSAQRSPIYSISEHIKPFVSHNESMIALVNATLINGNGSSALINQTIVIENGVFTAIGEQEEISIPDSAFILDVEGKTLIPGIIGVHNHLHIPGFPDIGEVASKLYLASGVTTIQTCGAARPYREIELSRAIQNQDIIGPEIIPSAPYFTGPGGSAAMIIPRSEQHIVDTMAHWLEQGVSWFKVYRHTRPEHLKIIIEQAHKNNAKVTGHFCSITFQEAVNMGIDGIEHGLNSASDFRTNKDIGICNGGRSYIDVLDISSDQVKNLHQSMIDNNVHLNSTLSIYEAGIPERAFADERSLKAMSPELVIQYQQRRERFDETNSTIDRLARLRRIMEFEYQFFQMGGLLGSGVDPGRHNLPGYGDQRNFELFIEAGFTAEEAIKVMSSNGAEILERDDIGTIKVGIKADFVILNGDLRSDPSVIRNVEFVFKNGVGYDPELIIEETHGQVGI